MGEENKRQWEDRDIGSRLLNVFVPLLFLSVGLFFFFLPGHH